MIKDKTLIINQIKEGKPDREVPLQTKLDLQKALMNSTIKICKSQSNCRMASNLRK